MKRSTAAPRIQVLPNDKLILATKAELLSEHDIDIELQVSCRTTQLMILNPLKTRTSRRPIGEWIDASTMTLKGLQFLLHAAA